MDRVNMDEIGCLMNKLKVAEEYNKLNPITDLVCSIIGIIFPPTSAVKDGINTLVNHFQEEKKKQFCDIILSDTKWITSDKVQDITFIIELSRTVDVINRLAQNDKVAYISRLFKKEFIDVDIYDVNLYEEYLHRLDYLSLREIGLLIELHEYSRIHNKQYHDEWYDFKKLAAEKNKVSEDSIVSIFVGLVMTGFCRESNVLFPSNGEIENPIYVTEYFKHFADMILDL